MRSLKLVAYRHRDLRVCVYDHGLLSRASISPDRWLSYQAEALLWADLADTRGGS